jgi:hypothetical protein
MATVDHTLEFLLALDGRIHHLEKRYSIRFEIKKVEMSEARPHGLSYSLTLHAPDGARLIGFDNAHRVARWLSLQETAAGERPLASFRSRVDRTLRVHGCRHAAAGFLSRSPPCAERTRSFRNSRSGRG